MSEEVVVEEVEKEIVESPEIDVESLSADELKEHLEKAKTGETEEVPEDEQLGDAEKKDEGEPETLETQFSKLKDDFEFIKKEKLQSRTEVGELRKALRLERERTMILQKIARDKEQGIVYDDDTESSNLEKNIEVSRIIDNNKSIILEQVPDFEDKLDAISGLLKEKGVSESRIAEVKDNPYSFKATEILDLVKELEKKNIETPEQKRVRELEEQVKAIVEKTHKMHRNNPSLTSVTSTTSEVEDELTEADVERMTPEQLKKELARRKKLINK